MPSIIDSLTIDKKAVAEGLISRLVSLKPMAEAYKTQINEFKERINTCTSTMDLLVLMREIVNKQIEIDKALFKIDLDIVDADIQAAVSECLQINEQLIPVQEVLNLDHLLRESLNSAQERLTMEDIFSSLSNEKRQVVERFVRSVHSLEPAVNELDVQKKYYHQLLAKVQSQAEVDAIEDEIEEYSKKVAATYDSSIAYPEDEETAIALIQFLESNPHLMIIVQHFDFHASMLEDLTEARRKA